MTITSLNIVDGTVGRTRLPKVRKPYVFLTIIIVILIGIVLAYSLGVFKQSKPTINDPKAPLPPSASRLHVFKKAAVCADGPPCAEIGRDILSKGGSAIDATIATMICNGVYTMQSMGMGGGFVMTIYKKDENKVYTLNAREKAPLGIKEEFYKNDQKTSKVGPLSIAVPGELMGYWQAHQRFGKLPWSDLIQPSIKFCNEGYLISHHQEASFQNTDVTKDHNLREWFVNEDGSLKKAGTKVIPKKLCDTLEVIAKEGALSFYNGSLSVKVVEDFKTLGSIITEEDLNNYTAEWMDPVSIKLKNGDTLYSVKPPGSGILLAFIMNILNNYNFTSASVEDEKSSILTHHRIIEAFKYAYAKRTELGDTEFVDLTHLLQELSDPNFGKNISNLISDNSTSQDPKHYGGIYFNPEDHGTAHISVISEEGDAVSVTSSVNIYFGSGLTLNQSGIIMNSVIDDFSFPTVVNYFGLPGSPNNALKPGKRPLSSMSPTIIIDDKDNVKMVIGASGGTKITSSVAFVIMKALWFDQNLKEAVDAPRIYHQLYPMKVQYEYGTLDYIVEGLKKLGHELERVDKATSIICALLKQADKIIANADYRKQGEVYGLD